MRACVCMRNIKISCMHACMCMRTCVLCMCNIEISWMHACVCIRTCVLCMCNIKWVIEWLSKHDNMTLRTGIFKQPIYEHTYTLTLPFEVVCVYVCVCVCALWTNYCCGTQHCVVGCIMKPSIQQDFLVHTLILIHYTVPDSLPDSVYLASCNCSPPWTCCIVVWDIASAGPVCSFMELNSSSV